MSRGHRKASPLHTERVTAWRGGGKGPRPRFRSDARTRPWRGSGGWLGSSAPRLSGLPDRVRPGCAPLAGDVLPEWTRWQRRFQRNTYIVQVARPHHAPAPPPREGSGAPDARPHGDSLPLDSLVPWFSSPAEPPEVRSKHSRPGQGRMSPAWCGQRAEDTWPGPPASVPS